MVVFRITYIFVFAPFLPLLLFGNLDRLRIRHFQVLSRVVDPTHDIRSFIANSYILNLNLLKFDLLFLLLLDFELPIVSFLLSGSHSISVSLLVAFILLLFLPLLKLRFDSFKLTNKL